ncbi:hypothetical protein [Mycolicibacterium sarraceniae]|uniref:Uncharacterized protein n=1 Tax=Mycolicibacterium sarraceniae TaxID=1534348 RepID=A0A7I7SPR8_9MYCO|nr:hypothetical protein [Mycolicibacterium sarraceniae]BBY58808.1 hypothetical protein MSAR_19440 [Mycolicibacterium sarraceniae]
MPTQPAATLLAQYGVPSLVLDRYADTFMQIGDVRYRLEFRLRPGESADDFHTLTAPSPLREPWITTTSIDELHLIPRAPDPAVRGPGYGALMVGRIMTAGGGLGNMLRRNIIPQLHRLPGLRDRVIDSRTPPLHRSGLVHRGRLRGRLGGTMCPNIAAPGGTRMDDIVGTGFVIVTAQVPSAADGWLAERYGAAVHVTSADSDLADWSRAGRDIGELVRLLGRCLVAVDENQGSSVQ